MSETVEWQNREISVVWMGPRSGAPDWLTPEYVERRKMRVRAAFRAWLKTTIFADKEADA